MKKKLYICLIVGMLLVSMMVVAVDSVQVKSLKATMKAGKISIFGVKYVDGKRDASVMKVDAFCRHDGTESLIGSTSDWGSSFTIKASTSCVKGDYAWVKIGDYKSAEVVIKKKHSTSVVIIPVNVCEAKYTSCLDKAQAKYDVAIAKCSGRFQKICEGLVEASFKADKLVCSYNQDKCVCEEDSLHEYVWNKNKFVCKDLVV